LVELDQIHRKHLSVDIVQNEPGLSNDNVENLLKIVDLLWLKNAFDEVATHDLPPSYKILSFSLP
jgi:hypothetical protein